MSPGGRRPGKGDTRGEIIEAAQRVFADKGYDEASLRAVAREAGVDPALVHHYFDGKAALFMAAMSLPFDPRPVQGAANADAASAVLGRGRPVEGFLTMWDQAEGTGSSFASCVGGHGRLDRRGRRHARVRQRAGLEQSARRIEGESEATSAAPRAWSRRS